MTNYYEQLVQRLREQYMDTKQMLPNVLCHDSADAITKLRAERDALKDELRRTCEHLGLDQLLAERDALRADLAAARAERDAWRERALAGKDAP